MEKGERRKKGGAGKSVMEIQRVVEVLLAWSPVFDCAHYNTLNCNESLQGLFSLAKGGLIGTSF